ncbi:MAG: hypothetical protein B7Z37_30275 [Verrucomicrobia bacterium 12-59-8]|nr:MAG: hypothetical protein B7Z37_30275 [Verrucomicrobia bacterium 12-59-8]
MFAATRGYPPPWRRNTEAVTFLHTPTPNPPMKSIQVYDPPMCCSTGICGTDIDPDLVNFAAMLAQFQTGGIKIERYNLGQQPAAFAQNDAVKALMIAEGTEVLPVIFWDGDLHLKGRYPTKDERPEWFRAAFNHEEAVAS